MATGYGVLAGNNGRIVVVLSRACTLTKAEILALLADAGLDPTIISFVEPGDIAKWGELDGTSVVMPLDDNICDAPEFESLGRQCAAAGARVIILFGPECHYDGLHPVADKYGTQCDWSAESLKGCVGGATDAPRDPVGKPAERPEAREVICRR